MPNPEAVITSFARTAIGSFGGGLAGMPATRIGAVVVKAAIQRSGLEPGQVEEVIMGNVLTAGVGQAPARQAALFAGLPNTVETFTVNKVCGSGLKAVMLADQAIRAGDAEVIIAGGMEAMSNVPYYLTGAREGLKIGHKEIVDGMIHDGLWDVYNDTHMGSCGDLCAREKGFSRAAQDEFAAESYRRAIAAQESGAFAREIVAVELSRRKGDPILFDKDEDPAKVNFEKLPGLRPAFDKEGTVTAANASGINDGAAAVAVMSATKAKALSVSPVARIVGHASGAHAPEWFTTAPAKAIAKVLEKTGLALADIDLFEINEAFAVVALAAIDELKLDPQKVNVHGGAVALGHPIGASGARILVTLLGVMEQHDVHRGMAAICIGGGEAAAIIVERP
ncbi:MAG: acetyl-CoA C-acetyltransferase [Candidatus Marinimicrobia bacterium]|nr:acetyl-CoA C-acetyltransferase [Candidatus Neomarinimicrobiota bacterium]